MRSRDKILLVEDNPSDCEVVRRSLQRSVPDVNLTVATCGQDAFRILNPTAGVALPHLVFVDLNLPDCDGKEILQRIRSNPVMAHIPTVVLTTSDSPRDVSECYRLGCNGYLVKPNSFAEYLSVMDATVRYWLDVVPRVC